MKKVGLYIPNLSNGGAERVVSRLSNLLNKDYEIYIILNEDIKKYDVKCKVINLNIPPELSLIKKVLLTFKRIKKLKKVKQIYKLDIVISFLTSANIVNSLSRVKTTSTILSVRNYTNLEKRKSYLSKVKDSLVKILYKKSDKVITVSKDIENCLIEEYKVPSYKIKTIYNPYDMQEIEYLSNREIENVEHKKFLETGKVFVTVGRLTYQKGYWHLLKAFSMLPKNNEAKLLIIGDGKDKSKIEKLIRGLHLEGKVLLVGYQENPFQYISRCYAYVLSSLFEGFPNAMVEAMACGCPVIAADCKSGPREILFKEIELGKNIDKVVKSDYGIIVPRLSLDENWNENFKCDSEKPLAAAINIILENNELRDHMVLKGKKRVLLFNYEVCRDNYSQVIENV